MRTQQTSTMPQAMLRRSSPSIDKGDHNFASLSGTIVWEGYTIVHDNSDHSENGINLSKTEVKNQMLALQALGEAIVKLSAGQLAAIPLDEKLKEAVDVARRTKSHEGLRRQLQYVGKLMRSSDSDAIKKAYQNVLEGRNENARCFHALEQLRDELIEQGPNAIEDLIEKYPQVDRQHLRQLIRAACKEKKLEKPLANSRKLFRYLRELDKQKRSED